jgi:drug/metabolite transporter (DMT)-like permease
LSVASLALVVTAAVLHATWNLLAKRAGEGGTAFVWLCALAMAAIYAPVGLVVYLVARPEIGAAQLAFMAGSGVLHLCYFTLLQHGYRVGDLSLVYPLARGTGPMLSTAAAILILDERPTALALAGAALVCVGVIVLGTTSESRDDRSRAPAVAFGLLTGGLIAVYTLWDKHAVGTLAVPPILLDVAANSVRGALLTPSALRRRNIVRDVWTRNRREVLGVAAIAPLAYILVLTALAVSPVSYVAPAREVSILIGTILGVRLLREGHLGPRIAGALSIVTGLAALALG